MTPVHGIFAKKLYDGESDSALLNQLVHVEGTHIQGIQEVAADFVPTQNMLAAEILAPGFIDIQINGVGDVMFNDAPTLQTLKTMSAAARCGGTAYLLPTFTTAKDQSFINAISAVQTALDEAVLGVLGIHLEGPFLSKDKPGIHPPEFIRPLNTRDLEVLKESKSGVKLITLAPEEDKIGAIASLVDAGWLVFAGHSNATFEQMANAMPRGLTGATHLFNAMSQITVREPGVVGAILNSKTAVAGIIVDGHHVHRANIKMAFELMGPERLILVTDAMQTFAGMSDGFEISGNKIILYNGRLVDKSGTLAGAHLAMDHAVQNIVKFLGIDTRDALKMASTTPAKALGLGHELGKIKKSYRASLTLLDKNLAARGVVADGQYFAPETETGFNPSEAYA